MKRRVDIPREKRNDELLAAEQHQLFDVLPDAVGKKEDNTLFSTRTEIHCRRCGGHTGHVFDDGPKPTGLRYCMNGVALTFAVA